MAQISDNRQSQKISPNLKARLARLGPEQKVYAILLLHTGDMESTSTRQQLRSKRKLIADRIHNAAAAALPEIDKILGRFNGQRLADSVDVLGSLPVEATAAGIMALADSTRVKAILEDQPVSFFPKIKRA
jgi:hypothetical protein